MPTVTTGAAESGAMTTRKPLANILLSIAICGPFTLASPYFLPSFLVQSGVHSTWKSFVPDFVKARAQRGDSIARTRGDIPAENYEALPDVRRRHRNLRVQAVQSMRRAGRAFRNYRAPGVLREVESARLRGASRRWTSS